MLSQHEEYEHILSWYRVHSQKTSFFLNENGRQQIKSITCTHTRREEFYGSQEWRFMYGQSFAIFPLFVFCCVIHFNSTSNLGLTVLASKNSLNLNESSNYPLNLSAFFFDWYQNFIGVFILIYIYIIFQDEEGEA